MRIPQRKSEKDKRAMARSGPIHLTGAGIAAMKQEMVDIQEQIPHVREELVQTREMGDLSENAGYQIAKATLRRLQNRLLRLQEDMKRVVEIEPQDSDKVQLGSTVVVKFNDNEFTFHIVGPRESNPAKGMISHRSPLGRVLLGASVGDERVLKRENGEISYTVLEIKK